MDNGDEVFQPEIIDEQIEHLLLIQHSSQQDATPGARTLAEIQQMYQECTSILENAWTRIAGHAATHHTLEEPVQIDSYRETRQMYKQTLPSETALINSETQPLPRQRSAPARPPRKRWHRVIEIGLVAAVVVATIFGWGIFSQTLHQKSPRSSLAATPGSTLTPGGTPDPHRGTPRCTFPLNPPAFQNIDWSSRGQIAVALSSPQMMLFNAATCKQSVTYPLSFQADHTAPSWSPDGQRLAVVENNEVKILNGSTGAVLATYHPQVTTGAAAPWVVYSSWSPDGRTVASTVIGANGTSIDIQLWNTSTGQHLRTLSLKASGGKTFWSSDGRYLIATGELNIWVWNTRTWQLTTYASHNRLTIQATWSPDGQFVAIALAHTDEVQVWNTRTGQITLAFHTQQVYTSVIAWSPNGRYLATANKDVRLWNAQTGQLIYTYHYRPTPANYPLDTTAGLAWSPDSKMFATLVLAGTNDGRQSTQDWSAISVWNVA